MKKFLLLLIGILFTMGMYAQALLSEDFEGYTSGDPINQNGWITIDTSGADTGAVWTVKKTGGTKFAKIDAYYSDTVEAFLISPEIDMTNLSANDEVNLYYDVAVGYWKHQGLTLYVATGMSSNITDTLNEIRNANLTVLQDSFQTTPTSGYGSFITYHENLNNYKGQKIRLVFYYYGNKAENKTTTFDIDNIKLTTYAVQNIDYVYTLNDTTLVVKYAGKLDVFDTAQFTLTGSNFGLKNIDLNDSISVYLYTDTTIVFDNVPDTINDGLNQTSTVFYAGVVPMPYLNSANTDTIATNGMLTVKGYVTANDEYNQVWIQDDTLTMHGILIYDVNKDLPQMVKVGDYITVVGTRSTYKGLSEIAFTELVNVDSTVQSPITPVVISGSTIGYQSGANQTVNDPNIEPYEGLLVKVENAKLISGPTTYYEYIGTDDGGATNFVMDDEIDYHYSSYDTVLLNQNYNITGVITYGYGYYRLNPLQKQYNGLEVVQSAAVNDVNVANLNVYPNPVYDELNITSESNINKVEIYNATGQAVKSINMSTSRASVNVADLQPGVYMVRIFTDKGIATSKIIKR